MANHQSNFTSNFGETESNSAALVISVNGVDYIYRPNGDDTSVSIPTVEKHNYDEDSLVATLTRILASDGEPIIRKSGHEYRFITSNDTNFVFANVIDGLVETLSIAKSDGTVTTTTSSTVKFVDPSLAQVTEAIAAGYLPMIKRMAGQGNRYFHLQWVGSEAWFASIGEEEISRLVIKGDRVTETTDKLRDVINISTINDGLYVSNIDYESALDGANANQVVILQSARASVTSKSYLVAAGSIGLRFIDVANDKVRLITVAPTQTENGHAVTYEDLANGGFTDIVAFDFTDYTDSVAGNIAYPIANNKMQIQSDWDGSLNNQAVFIAPSDTSNNAIVKLENVQTTINWNVQIWNHSKTALLPLVPGSATVFKKDASYVIHLYGDKVYVSQVADYAAIGNGEIVSFDVRFDAGNKAYIFPAAQDVINAVGKYIEVQLVVHTPAGVNFVYALTYKSALNYEWTREDCQARFNLVGTGDPVVWTWTPGYTRLKLEGAALDENIGKVSASIAPDYSSLTFPITEGTLCMYARSLYTCSASGGIPAIEDWNAEHWTQTKVSELIGDVETLLAAL